MNDFYHEQSVERARKRSDIILIIALVAVLAVFIFLGYIYIGIWCVFIAAAVVVLFYFLVFSKMKVEYEYFLTNTTLEVDMVVRGKKRKSLADFDIKRAEIVAPQNSATLNNVKIKPKNFFIYSAEDKAVMPYAIIFTDRVSKQQACLLMDLDETMVDQFLRVLGPKVVHKK